MQLSSEIASLSVDIIDGKAVWNPANVSTAFVSATGLQNRVGQVGASLAHVIVSAGRHLSIDSHLGPGWSIIGTLLFRRAAKEIMELRQNSART